MIQWQLQDAKNRLSEVVSQAQKVGPQCITLRGKDAVVVVSIEEYRRLTRKQESLTAFFRQSPLAGESLEITRSDDTGRDIDL